MCALLPVFRSLLLASLSFHDCFTDNRVSFTSFFSSGVHQLLSWKNRKRKNVTWDDGITADERKVRCNHKNNISEENEKI